MSAYLRAVPPDVELTVKIVPGASRDRIVGPLGDALKIRIAAPPEKGNANAAVIALLAEVLGLTTKQLTVLRGQTNPRKIVRITGVTLEQAAQLIDAASTNRR